MCVFVSSASISSFLTVLAWYPNTSLRTWCLVLHSLTLMTNMSACGQYSTLLLERFTYLVRIKSAHSANVYFQPYHFQMCLLNE